MRDVTDDDPDPDELREAEALARALERGVDPSGDLPDDAFSAAALLRYGTVDGALSDERRDAILEEVLSTARAPRVEERAPLLRWLRWLVPVAGLAGAAAAALLVVQLQTQVAPSAHAELPPPPVELLRAQASAAGRATPEAIAELDRRMRGYRGAFHGSLNERYGR